jgi:DNA-binding SARP family transcriptional activator
VAVSPPTRIVLLDGFALYLAEDPQPASLDLPRAVQRLVARLSLSRCPDRNAVAGSLWPDVPERSAHGSLRSALWRLNRVAPGTVCVSGGSLALAEGVRVDVRDLDTWAARVLDPTVRGDEISVPDDALRGELLPGWCEDWVLLERERLRQLRLHALETLAEKLVACRRFGEAADAAYAAVRAEPLRESAHRVVVRVHLAEGNLAEARRAYEQFRSMLAAALGVAPTSQMTHLLAEPRQDPGCGSDGSRVAGGRASRSCGPPGSNVH